MSSEEIPVVKVLIRNDEGEFLVVKEEESGQWELPGGFIEEDEDRFKAAEREIEEEVDLEVGDLEDVVREEIEAGDHINCYILFTENFSGKIETGGDVSEAAWVAPEEFLGMDWHADAGYGIPPMMFLDDYLGEDKSY